MSQENATAFCNDCGAWKRITGREARTALGSAVTIEMARQQEQSISRLRRASVINGATGAIIARRTAPGFRATED